MWTFFSGIKLILVDKEMAIDATPNILLLVLEIYPSAPPEKKVRGRSHVWILTILFLIVTDDLDLMKIGIKFKI